MTDCHLANRVNLLRELIEDAYAAKGVTDDPATWGSEMVLVVLLKSGTRCRSGKQLCAVCIGALSGSSSTPELRP